jgi:hypothetical protein
MNLCREINTLLRKRSFILYFNRTEGRIDNDLPCEGDPIIKYQDNKFYESTSTKKCHSLLPKIFALHDIMFLQHD